MNLEQKLYKIALEYEIKKQVFNAVTYDASKITSFRIGDTGLTRSFQLVFPNGFEVDVTKEISLNSSDKILDTIDCGSGVEFYMILIKSPMNNTFGFKELEKYIDENNLITK